jgi:hypothetical protein
MLGTGDASNEWFLYARLNNSATPNNNVGTPSFRLNSVVKSFIDADDVLSSFSTQKLVTAVSVDFSGWSSYSFAYGGGTLGGFSKVQFLTIFDIDQSANRTAIETAINNEYSIY